MSIILELGDRICDYPVSSAKLISQFISFVEWTITFKVRKLLYFTVLSSKFYTFKVSGALNATQQMLLSHINLVEQSRFVDVHPGEGILQEGSYITLTVFNLITIDILKPIWLLIGQKPTNRNALYVRHSIIVIAVAVVLYVDSTLVDDR